MKTEKLLDTQLTKLITMIIAWRITLHLCLAQCVILHAAFGRNKPSINIGYITGARKREGDFFYNKPGQSISGSLTLAIKVGVDIELLSSSDL